MGAESDVHVAEDHGTYVERRDLPEVQNPVRRRDGRKEDAKELSERHADCGDGTGLNNKKESPAIEEAPERAESFAQENILASGAGHHGGKFAVAEGADDSEKAGYQPGADQQCG